jgi:hypothetical protein
MGSLPILVMDYTGPEGQLRIEALGGQDADIVKLTLSASAGSQLTLPAMVRSNVAIGSKETPTLMRHDGSLFCLVQGAPECKRSYVADWDLEFALTSEGDSRTVWVIIPHATDLTDTAGWQSRDWAAEWRDGERVWLDLLDDAARFIAPDEEMLSGYYACLADQFILREPLAGGETGFLCGTDKYRAVNAYEINAHVHALLRAGYFEEAWQAAKVLLPQQREDGRWEDISPWIATFWLVNGDIPLLFEEIYRFTGNRDRMAAVWPQLAKLARWVERERSKSKELSPSDPNYGLMPPGVGDGGICRDLRTAEDLWPHHVFFPHNVGNVGGLRVVAELAKEFGSQEEQKEFSAIYEDAHHCLLASMERCAVALDGTRYVPPSTYGAEGGGSLWQCSAFAYPWRLLPYDHPLVSGSLAWFEANQSPTGVPYNTGWQDYGVWPGGAIESPAPVYLRRGDSDALADLVYAALNHGSPVWTWPEERRASAGTPVVSGDLQEAWLPVNFCWLFRDMFLYEEGDTLHIAAGIPRDWYRRGPVGVENAPSYFGKISYAMDYSEATRTVTLRGFAGSEERPCRIVAHLNLPENGSNDVYIEAKGEFQLTMKCD